MNSNISISIFAHRLCTFVVSFLALGCLIVLKGAQADTQGSNISFSKMTVTDGMSSDSINAIFQDSRGYLWFATQDGLNRYDGHSIKQFLYSPKDTNTISAPWINSIVEDQDGRIWAGTDNGLSIINPITENVRRIYASDPDSGLSSNRIGSLYNSDQHDILIIAEQTLNKYSSITDKIEKLSLADDDGKALKITTLLDIGSGNFLLGTAQSGLFLFTSKNNTLAKLKTHFANLNDDVYTIIQSLYLDSRGTLWIGSENKGLFSANFKDALLKKEILNISLVSKSRNIAVKSMLEDEDGNMWFASDKGLGYYVNDASLKFITRNPRDPKSLASDKVDALFIDSSGIFWVGTFAGVSKWNTFSKYFTNIDADGDVDSSLSGSDITGIDAINNELALVANLKGLDLVNTQSGLVQHIPIQNETEKGLAEAEVMAVKYSNEKEIWVGYRSRGVSKFELSTLEFSHYPYDANSPNSIGARGIPYIIKLDTNDKNNPIWFTTFGGGISNYNNIKDSFTSYTRSEENNFTLSADRVVSAFQSNNGLVWLGTLDGGINLFNPTTKSNYRVNEQLDNRKVINETVWGFAEDSYGNMWVATNGRGLLFISASTMNRGKFDYQMFVREDGLPSNNVVGIEIGYDGNIWASTNKGLVKIDPVTFEMKVFTRAHGLKGDNFNSLSHTQLPDGRLIFGSTSGITIFDPKKLAKEKRHFPIEITQFHKLNQSFNPAIMFNDDDEIVVKHDDYLVGFEFAGLDYVSPKDNKYKYRLTGFDPDWIDADEGNKAVYTNLPSGDYVFQVIGANSDGHWNEEGASVKLVVKPPLWLSIWAYVVYFVIFFLVLMLSARIARLRSESEKRYLEKLENDVDERTQELQRLNKELLSASVTDQLTGLHNRRYLNDVLPGVAKEALQKFTAVVADCEESVLQDGQLVAPRIFFLMFDMDGFKPVNDTYGHDVGDKVIEQVANLLKDVCRVNDIVVRWGGDEFLIVGHVNQAIEATQLAERVRAAIANHKFDLGISQPIHLSSSIGFSLYPFSQFSPDALTWDHVHILADNALYESKDNGRNTWTGILPKNELLPYSALNQITANVEAAIDHGFVELVAHKKS